MKDFEHRGVMVDLETLATDPSAHILSIGAVAMHDLNNQFYVPLGGTLQDRVVNPDTLNWWSAQNEKALSAAFDIEPLIDIAEALQQFASWYISTEASTVWSHGAVFDVMILQNAFDQYDVECPWKFWQVRDTRTLIDMVKRIAEGRTLQPIRDGAHHNALDDAIHQSKWMNKIFDVLYD